MPSVRVSGESRLCGAGDGRARGLGQLGGQPAKGEVLAGAQKIPLRFLENILGELRVHGLVQSRRGSDGGYWLARPADDVTIAEVIRAVEGPLATVRGESADEIEYRGDSQAAARGLAGAAGRTSARCSRP